MEISTLKLYMEKWGFNPDLIKTSTPWSNEPPLSENVIKFLREYIGKFPEASNLFLIGSPRSIQRVLSNIIAQLILNSKLRNQAFFLDVPTYIVDQFYSSPEGDQKEQQFQVKSQLNKSDLFVFNEISLNNWTSNQQLRIYSMVNTRYQLQLPCIYTSSKSDQETVEALIDSTYYRIEEKSTFLKLPW